MIIDRNTDQLYLSDLLERNYPDFFKNFKRALDENGIIPEFLAGTKDVWCVDFMPVQVNENRFVQFKFDPTYLRFNKYDKTITDPSVVYSQLDIKPTLTDIIADGGNVTRDKNKVIMTTRVIEENPQYSLKELTEKIKELLELDQLILVPTQPDDFTGHSDGMVRFLDERTVLLNDYSQERNQEFVLNLKVALHNAGLEAIEIPTTILDNEKLSDATGDYINYLHMDGIIFIPIFNRKEDETVVKLFENIFTGTTIVPVESTQLAKDGGILNCISWNIKQPKSTSRNDETSLLSEIQRKKFFETSGQHFRGREREGKFLTKRAYNDEKWEQYSPWIFNYIIESDTGNLICELEHKMTNNRIYGWDKDGNELPEKITLQYFKPHL